MAETNRFLHRPHPDRVSEAFAAERIAEKIASLLEARQRAGITDLDDGLVEAGIAPSLRLHLVSAVVALGRVSEETRPARLERADGRRAVEPPIQSSLI